MTDKEMAVEYVRGNTGFSTKEPLGKIAVRTYLAGLKAGIGKLRYCCTCKKWKECKVVSMYGICADLETKIRRVNRNEMVALVNFRTADYIRSNGFGLFLP